jgi:hypothetical protein
MVRVKESGWIRFVLVYAGSLRVADDEEEEEEG